jgi:hypothetical protein
LSFGPYTETTLRTGTFTRSNVPALRICELHFMHTRTRRPGAGAMIVLPGIADSTSPTISSVARSVLPVDGRTYAQGPPHASHVSTPV